MIQDSHKGHGLGDRFLRHIQRTKIILHLIDMAATEGRDPIEDYIIINKELSCFSQQLKRKPQVIVANKMDLSGAEGNLSRFRQSIKKRIYPISAFNKQGLEELIAAIKKRLSTHCN